jgi:hypothetical protein
MHGSANEFNAAPMSQPVGCSTWDRIPTLKAASVEDHGKALGGQGMGIIVGFSPRLVH